MLSQLNIQYRGAASHVVLALVFAITLSPRQAVALLADGATLNIDNTSFFALGGGMVPSSNIVGHDGLVTGTVQPATGSHSGAPGCTAGVGVCNNPGEQPGIDEPWSYFNSTGMHQTTSASNVLSASGNSATIDFSGWNVTWNGIPSIVMGSGAWAGNPDGQADVVCGTDCGNGDTYTLTYSATVPNGDPSGFGGVPYYLELHGTVTAAGANVPPVANDFSVTTNQNSTTNSIDLLAHANDSDGQPGALSLQSVTQGTNGGTVTDNGDGTANFTPPAGFAGSDSFTYTVTDTLDTATGTVSVTVNAVQPVVRAATGNAGPVTPGTIATAVSSSTGAITLANLTNNSVPADSDVQTSCVGGCFDYTAASTSAQATVVLPLSAALPAQGKFRLFASGVWQDFVVDGSNAVKSAQGTLGSCPPPGSSGYVAGIFPGYFCVQLTVQDNGPNDADSTSGQVRQTGGPAAPISGGSAGGALATGTVLTLGPGNGCNITAIAGLPASSGNGSCFGMENNPGFVTLTQLTNHEGLIVGAVQPASNSHTGAPDGSESPSVDEPWVFFGNAGMHQTTKPVVDLGGNTLDLSGWSVTWNGIDSIPMGTGANSTTAPGFQNGIAQYTCSSSCANGDTYTLDYSATVPIGDPSGFGNVAYSLHLEGTVVVPETLSSDAVGGIQPGATAQAAGSTTGRLTLDELTNAGIPEDTVDNPSGIYYDFSASVAATGDTARIVIPLSAPLPSDPVWRKYNTTTGWNNFNVGSFDSISSAPGSLGSCPAAGDASYTAGLTEGNFCVQLTIQDNGTDGNDTDATGAVIGDPGFAGSSAAPPVPPPDTRTSGTSGCSATDLAVGPTHSADWWLVAGFIFWLGALRHRKRIR